eukprot:5147263-Ditylum_brightwellii.AAC.1
MLLVASNELLLQQAAPTAKTAKGITTRGAQLHGRPLLPEQCIMAAHKIPLGDVSINGPVHNLCEVMQNVVASAAEAKVGALFSNARIGEQLRFALKEMGHQQPPTPICTDNSTADGIINNKLKQCWSCAIDMHFYW